MATDPEKSDERLAQRRAALLVAARRLFLDVGFEETTLSHVVAEAGGSLSTLYKLFGSKEGLLHAVVFEMVQSGADVIREIGRKGLTPAAALMEVGEELQRRFLSPEDVALVRVLITRSACDPDFARAFFERTRKPTIGALEALFTRWQEQGLGVAIPPNLLARIFLSVLIEDLRSEMFFQTPFCGLSDEERDFRIGFFLRGAGLRDDLRDGGL
ncbi:MAG: TetR/AcrR family transcriptional regulator [Porphyrobacter sp.]|nr:TetR/AcrR family transcriptional regulator [Porphyrobacter sp.]